MTAKKANKKQSIINAFMQCVVEQGLSSSSMSEIASRIGIDRSSLYYYFKSREELIDALVKCVVELYIEQFYSAISAFSVKKQRVDQLIEHLFGPSFHQPELSMVIDELAALANRDKHTSALVKSIYQAFELAIFKEIELAYPESAIEDRRWVAYAINQLAEGCSVFTSYGFNEERLLACKKAARHLLAHLEN